MISLAEFLLNTKHEYNGHLQTEIKGLSIKKGIRLCKELEQHTNDEYSFVLEVWSDGNYTIYQKDYWKAGEHPLGHTDRIVLGVGNSD